jgi:hypothetical protein
MMSETPTLGACGFEGHGPECLGPIPRIVEDQHCPTCQEEPGIVGEPCLSRGNLRDPWHDAAEEGLA